jgi:aerobic carbon-monoxide dehydrogenase medium subunit
MSSWVVTMRLAVAIRPVLRRPETVAEACELLAADEAARPYGGGTAIEIERHQGTLSAPVLVDLSRVPGLDRIDASQAGLRVGSMVTIRRIETDPLVARIAPLAASAYGKVANPRVRNAATVGGNVALGAYRLDSPAALVVLGAVVEATSVRGSRRIPATGFFTGIRRTALQPDELVTAIEFPALPPGAATSYVKLCSLAVHDWPCASAAASLIPEGSGQGRLRLSVGALGAVPRLTEIPLSDRYEKKGVEAAVAAAEALMDPIGDVRGSAAYKRALGRVAVEDAVRRVLREAGRDH